MTEVVFEHQSIDLHPGESVLEGLLRSGFRIPNSCRKGLCHACLMHTSGSIPAQAQAGLSDLQKEQGLFLSCCCYPPDKTNIKLAERASLLPARVIQKIMLSDSVLQLTLKSDARGLPGQHVLLWKDEVTARPYSIASLPDQAGCLVLHIQRHLHGQVSEWCHDQLQIDDRLTISLPEGHCVYDPHDTEKPLLLIATDTGLAPLYGVLQEALAKHHQGHIDLYHETENASDFYLHNELQQLMTLHSQFTYHPVIKQVNDSAIPHGKLLDNVINCHSTLRGSKVYLAGSPEMIAQLNRQCFMAGAGRSDIVSEPFGDISREQNKNY